MLAHLGIMEIRKISTENFGEMADKHYDVMKLTYEILEM